MTEYFSGTISGTQGCVLLTIRIQTRGYIYDLTDFRSDTCQEEQYQNSKGQQGNYDMPWIVT